MRWCEGEFRSASFDEVCESLSVRLDQARSRELRADQEYQMKKKYSPELRQHIIELEARYTKRTFTKARSRGYGLRQNRQTQPGQDRDTGQCRPFKPVVTLWKFARGERQVVDSIVRSCS